MIICHPLKIIFLKTKKVGGTSFEIALSKFCESNCVITPITKKDELFRINLGHRSSQNYINTYWPEYDLQTQGQFHNHITAPQLRKGIPEQIWTEYTKISIFRNPFDAIISRYYRDGGLRTGYNFDSYVEKHRSFLSENIKIAPIYGANKLDVYLKYESIESELRDLGFQKIYDVFKNIHAKSGFRTKESRDLKEFYKLFPVALQMVMEDCLSEINYFDYDIPF